MRELVIADRRIADDEDCYVIAEIGHNHQGSITQCKELFDAAKWAGCDAVKLQKRDNKTLYTEEYYNAPYNSENAFGPTYGLHREALEFNWDQYADLQAYANKLGIAFFATAFDKPSLEFLVELHVPAIKIASGDAQNLSLIREAYLRNIPVIVSTGGCSGFDCLPIQADALLHCTSGYPAKYEELNLRAISWFRDRFFNTTIGWSAHDTGIAMAPVAYALGARIIEKHFTLNRAWKGTDQAFSLEPQGMRAMVESLKQAHQALGDGIKRVYESEKKALAKQWKNASGQIDGKVSGPNGSWSPRLGTGAIASPCAGTIYPEADRNEAGC